MGRRASSEGSVRPGYFALAGAQMTEGSRPRTCQLGSRSQTGSSTGIHLPPFQVRSPAVEAGSGQRGRVGRRAVARRDRWRRTSSGRTWSSLSRTYVGVAVDVDVGRARDDLLARGRQTEVDELLHLVVAPAVDGHLEGPHSGPCRSGTFWPTGIGRARARRSRRGSPCSRRRRAPASFGSDAVAAEGDAARTTGSSRPPRGTRSLLLRRGAARPASAGTSS